MQKICNINIHNNKSPLCNNYTLYNNLKQISKDKGVSFTLMLGISYAESHIGANFAPGCSLNEYYNLGGVKARKTDEGITVRDYPIPDSKGCRLYKFTSIEDYWTSKANSLKFGYINKGCSTPSCISKYYVLGYGGVKTGWVNRVNTFYLLN